MGKSMEKIEMYISLFANIITCLSIVFLVKEWIDSDNQRKKEEEQKQAELKKIQKLVFQSVYNKVDLPDDYFIERYFELQSEEETKSEGETKLESIEYGLTDVANEIEKSGLRQRVWNDYLAEADLDEWNNHDEKILIADFTHIIDAGEQYLDTFITTLYENISGICLNNENEKLLNLVRKVLELKIEIDKLKMEETILYTDKDSKISKLISVAGEMNKLYVKWCPNDNLSTAYDFQD